VTDGCVGKLSSKKNVPLVPASLQYFHIPVPRICMGVYLTSEKENHRVDGTCSCGLLAGPWIRTDCVRCKTFRDSCPVHLLVLNLALRGIPQPKFDTGARRFVEVVKIHRWRKLLGCSPIRNSGTDGNPAIFILVARQRHR
jgi:hypothetical protein